MSIQNIIDNAQQIEIDRRRMIGQSVSRSQRVKTAERSTSQPWKFKVTPPGMLSWATSRGFIEVINLNDRANEYEISLNNNPGMNYITEYQGECTPSQLNALTIYAQSTSTLTLTNLPTIGQNSVLFAQGDLIQPANSRYPYAVAATVLRGATTTTNVTLHRSIITSENINLVGQHVKVANSCTWRMLVSALPTYQLVPGRFVQYTGDFELIEKVI
jgi:hypothetical protein